MPPASFSELLTSEAADDHGKVRMFAPFVNREYKNTWGHALKWYGADGKTPGQDVVEYYQEKVRTKGARQENVIDDVQEGWANGHIICNEHCPPGEAHSQFWGDQLLVPLRDMLHALCEARAGSTGHRTS